MASKRLDAHFGVNETKSEAALRKSKDFPAVEAAVSMGIRLRSAPILSGLSTFLGSHNPFARPVDPATGKVWVFDATANHHGKFTQGQNSWSTEIVAAYFQRASGDDIATAVSNIAKAVGLAKGDAAEKTIEERVGPFFDQIQPARYCFADIESGPSNVKLGPSDRNGISTTKVKWQADQRDGAVHNVKVKGSVRSCGGEVTYAAETGWAVISDIDDTIKRTLTEDPVGILKTTFVEQPEPIKGMPEFYKHMKELVQDPPFWYLSASPYNLYPFLRDFRDAHYPAGTILLRNNSWMNIDVAAFLASMSRGTQAYKVGEMRRIQANFPKRRMICIGDTTQSDPEAYAETYRAHPDWIKLIFIRKVEDVTEIADLVTPGDDNVKRGADARFEKAFEGVPRDVWHVFEDPQELYAVLEAGVKRVDAATAP